MRILMIKKIMLHAGTTKLSFNCKFDWKLLYSLSYSILGDLLL